MTTAVSTYASALGYAEAGYRVLALASILADDDDTSVYHCSCPRGNSCTLGPGKHPHPMLSPHGAYSATSDTTVIDAWQDEYFNVGIALGYDGLAAIDIDDPDACAALQQLDADGEFRDMVVTRTGRGGYHFWVRSEQEVPNGIMYSEETGVRLGEVRAMGQYVVAPSSLHLSGRRYAFTGPSLIEESPVRVEDAWWYAQHVLSWISVTLARRSVDATFVPLTGSIDERALGALPFEPSTLLAATMQPGHINEHNGKPDKSATLYWLACELYREGDAADQDLDPALVAGVIKAKDLAWGQVAKFARRHNADEMYWTIANRARASTRQRTGENHSASSGSYAYADGWFCQLDREGAPVHRIANFEARIVARVHDMESQEDDWVIRASRPGRGDDDSPDEAYEVTVSPQDWADPPSFTREVERKLPSDWVISDRFRRSYRMAIQLYSGPVEVRHMYRDTGWLDGRDAFLLPDERGAITPDGFDSSTRLEHRDSAPPYRNYHDVADLQTLAKILFEAAPPHIIMPLVLQALAAPLTSVLMSERRTLVHLVGPTNSFKTLLSEAVMGIYGTAQHKQDLGVHSWGSTENFLLDAIHLMRDLPILLDDYKVDIVRRTNTTTILQMLGDEQQRSRLRVTQGRGVVRAQSREPRALGISTGEDLWWDQRSKLSRTIYVPVARGDINREHVTALRRVSRSGDLSALGVAYIRFLVTQGRTKLIETFEQRLDEAERFVSEYISLDEHPRLCYTVSSLVTVGFFLQNFISTAIPGYKEAFMSIRNKGLVTAMQNLSEQAQKSAELSPSAVVRDMLDEMLMSGRGMFLPLRGSAFYGTSGPTLGWWDQIGTELVVLLTKETTWAELLKEAARQRRDLPFVWENFTSEARREWNADNPPIRMEGQQRRMWRVPVTAMGLQMDQEATT